MSDVRGSLAEGLAAAVTPEKVTALVDAALTATKTHWAEIQCPSCHKTKKHPIEIHDARTSAQVLQIIATEGLGKASTAERDVTFMDGSKSKVLKSREEFEGLSTEELRAIADGKLEADWANEFSRFSDDQLIELETELPAERERRARLAAEVVAAVGPRIFRPKGTQTKTGDS